MSDEEIAALLDDALKLCQSGALTQAAQIYRQVIAASPDTPDAWNNLALIHYQQDRFEDAAEAAEHATRLRPHIPQYWLARGNIELALHRLADALISFSRAIGLAPDFAEAYFRRGLAYHRDRKNDLAIEEYRKALRLAPDVAEIHYQLAEALTMERRWVEAMSAYQETFTRDPNYEFDRRGCFDCMRRLQADALPEFWNAEIVRFFTREDIDKTTYAMVALRALMTKHAFRTVLSASRHPEGFEPDIAALHAVMNDVLFQTLLRDALLGDPDFEALLTRLRAAMLLDAEQRATAPADFLCALALQSDNNEFIFAENDAECAALAILLHEIDAELQPGCVLSDKLFRRLAVFAMYRPLHAIRGAAVLAEQPHAVPGLEPLIQRSVINLLKERKLQQDVIGINTIADDVSVAVRNMYEEHPYPRWFSLDRERPLVFADWLEREIPMVVAAGGFSPAPRILVAGCGTGQDAIWLATGIEGATVLAVDLSRASLAYAQRMANELRVSNIEFRHGDILGLGKLTERFDFVYSKGVLHHMREPAAGMRVLSTLVRPGGLLKVGLYSERARACVNAARKMIREQNLPATEAAIREFRQYVFNLTADSPLKRLCSFRDFYSMSMCRDLIFHVQEHQFRLPQVGAMLSDLELRVLGLSDVPQEELAAYREMFPDDDDMTNFQKWDVFEAAHPDTFVQMYQIWCRRRPGNAPSGIGAPD